nr:MAG TPA: Polo box domain [Caudoviricetes sp.]
MAKIRFRRPDTSHESALESGHIRFGAAEG